MTCSWTEVLEWIQYPPQLHIHVRDYLLTLPRSVVILSRLANKNLRCGCDFFEIFEKCGFKISRKKSQV